MTTESNKIKRFPEWPACRPGLKYLPPEASVFPDALSTNKTGFTGSSMLMRQAPLKNSLVSSSTQIWLKFACILTNLPILFLKMPISGGYMIYPSSPLQYFLASSLSCCLLSLLFPVLCTVAWRTVPCVVHKPCFLCSLHVISFWTSCVVLEYPLELTLSSEQLRSLHYLFQIFNS